MDLLLIVMLLALCLFFLKGKRQGASASINPPIANPDSGANAENGLENFMQAIFHFEGGRPGDRNVRNNNPGNLKSGPGMTGTAGGYATFADQNSGWTALKDLIEKRSSDHPDWNFYDFFNYYLRGSTTAPPVDQQGNSNAYAEYVANYIGAEPTQTVSSALMGEN